MVNKDDYYIQIAEVVATRSKCVSLQVGAVLVKDDRIISTGVNGTPRGFINCNEKFKERCDEHHHWSLKFEVHAESNALLQCDVSLRDTELYCTHSPCFNCIKHVIAAGVTRVVYKERYHRFTDAEFEEIETFCKQNNVLYIQLEEEQC